MADLPQTTLTGNGSTRDLPPPRAPSVSEPVESSLADLDVLTALRQALVEGTRPPASIIHATAEFARILTNASGVALALRVKGTVVCRARSGDLAPEVGSRLSEDSGISGECLRTAATLICHDSDADDRVDPDVCRAMGVRSIAAIPLLGPIGVVGILEAFSERTYAFDDEAIRTLRGLAEIAVAAHERESGRPEARRLAMVPPAVVPPAVVPPARVPRAMTPAPAVAPALPAKLVAAPAIPIKERLDQILQERLASRRYWIPGVAVAALLLIFLVARFSWRNTAPGLAASNGRGPALNAVGSTSITPLNVAPAKPPSGIATVRSDRPRTSGAVQNAAQIETVENSAGPAGSSTNVPSATQPAQGALSSATPIPASEPPPAVVVAAADVPSNLPGFTSGPVSLPKLEARVSDVTQATLIHKVDPTYPPQARTQRLAGSVVLDTLIAENGSVHDIKVVSGPPLLVDAATRAVRQWRYSPLLLNGTPTAVQKRITVVFTLP